MLSNQLEYLVQGDPRFLGGSPDRRLALPQAIEGVVDPRLSKPAFDEPAEGLRPIRLESLREPIDFSQALLRKADGHRLGHVYDIILRIHRPFQARCELPVWRRPTTASKILAKMQDTEREFLNDLFEAKLKYVTTRPYWNEPQAKPKLY